MKKICLTVVGLFILLFHAFSQSNYKKERINNGFDTTIATQYESSTLHLEQVDLVSSYYKQDGNHSSVTGGVGTEKVTDLSNGLELKFLAKTSTGKKITLVTGLGIDHHTAASSAWVNKTGASKTSGTRVYPSLSLQSENQKGNSWSAGMYFSGEYNYKSFGIDAGLTHKVGTGGELSVKGSAYLDKVTMILPSELIPQPTYVGPTVTTTASGRRVSTSGYYLSDDEDIPTSPRNTFTGTLSYAQVINKKLQVSGTMDLVAQDGFLSLPFHRVYDNAGTVHQEKLPDQRFKIPLGFRANYFLNDLIILRTFYRYYQDNWGVKAHTVSLEVPVKLSPFFSISPFVRAYSQTASKYFAPYKVHKAIDEFYTSNYAYAKLNSFYFGGGIHLSPPNGIFGTALSAVDIRYAQYKQSTDLNSNIISVALQWK